MIIQFFKNLWSKYQTRKPKPQKPNHLAIKATNYNLQQNLSKKYNGGLGVYRDTKGRFTSIYCLNNHL